jgi:hypothetical protein
MNEFYAVNIRRLEYEISGIEDAQGSPDALWFELEEKRQSLVTKLERLKKKTEIESRLSNEYQVTVVFTRQLSDDLDYALDTGMQFDVGLVQQFVRELQESIETSGEPTGTFEVSRIEFWNNEGRKSDFEVFQGEDGIVLNGPY